MVQIPNLLIIAGSGNKSGKTTMACRLADQMRDKHIVAVKITPHFHDSTPGLEFVAGGDGYSVSEETNRDTSKDTSRMLKAGAERVFYARVSDSTIMAAFEEILKKIPEGSPVVCESPALRQFVEPGLFIIMKSVHNENQKEISSLLQYPHSSFTLDGIKDLEKLPVSFVNGRWTVA
ncbi:MAG: hypothetical protein RBT38_09555 [Bacteroidales bacterium]|jgi:hypothetical protein|nr:hypothetical protein [Bacteroidales bacterium]